LVRIQHGLVKIRISYLENRLGCHLLSLAQPLSRGRPFIVAFELDAAQPVWSQEHGRCQMGRGVRRPLRGSQSFRPGLLSWALLFRAYAAETCRHLKLQTRNSKLETQDLQPETSKPAKP
jgi:hypothetical protein